MSLPFVASALKCFMLFCVCAVACYVERAAKSAARSFDGRRQRYMPARAWQPVGFRRVRLHAACLRVYTATLRLAP